MKTRIPFGTLIVLLGITAFYSFVFAAVGAVNGISDNESAYITEGGAEHFGAYAGKTVSAELVQPDGNSEDEYAVTTWVKNEYDSAASVSAVPAYTEPATQSTTAPVTTSIIETKAANKITAAAANKSASNEAYAQGFTFKVYGNGHGCGLSQNGANYLAIYGKYNYSQILNHFYTGVVLANTGTAETETLTVNGVSGSALEIVSMVCNQEVGPSFHVEAIKAQAVAAYTYIKYNGGRCSGIGLRANPPAKIVNAVKSVLGQALYYNNKFCLAQFCASSGGATASCKDIFTKDIPYLRSVDEPYDSLYDPYYGKETVFTVDYVRKVLESRLGIKLSDNPENWFKLVKGDGGYISKVIIDGKVTVKGSTLRSYFRLKSAKFEVTFQKAE